MLELNQNVCTLKSSLYDTLTGLTADLPRFYSHCHLLESLITSNSSIYASQNGLSASKWKTLHI